MCSLVCAFARFALKKFNKKIFHTRKNTSQIIYINLRIQTFGIDKMGFRFKMRTKSTNGSTIQINADRVSIQLEITIYARVARWAPRVNQNQAVLYIVTVYYIYSMHTNG